MISFVYFDVGGVVIRDISTQGDWDQYKKDIGISEERYSEFDDFWEEQDIDFCVDKPVDEAIPVIADRFNVTFPPNYSIQNDFLTRLAKNESIWSVIRKTHENAKLGLLTNMYPGFLSEIFKNGLMPDISWDVIVDSSVVKVKKPDKLIYEIAQRMAAVNAEEILFIDNSKKNVETAKNIGWNALLYDPLNPEISNKEILQTLNIQ